MTVFVRILKKNEVEFSYNSLLFLCDLVTGSSHSFNENKFYKWEVL